MRVGRTGMESGRLEGDLRAKVACGLACDCPAKNSFSRMALTKSTVEWKEWTARLITKIVKLTDHEIEKSRLCVVHWVYTRWIIKKIFILIISIYPRDWFCRTTRQLVFFFLLRNTAWRITQYQASFMLHSDRKQPCSCSCSNEGESLGRWNVVKR